MLTALDRETDKIVYLDGPTLADGINQLSIQQLQILVEIGLDNISRRDNGDYTVAVKLLNSAQEWMKRRGQEAGK